MLLPELPDLYEFAVSLIAVSLFGLLSTAAVYVAQRKHTPMTPTTTEPIPAEQAMDMVRGGINREFKRLPGPRQRILFLRMIRAELNTLYGLAGEELFKEQANDPQRAA